MYIRDIIEDILYQLPTEEFNKLDFKYMFLFGLETAPSQLNTNIVNVVTSCARYTLYRHRNIVMQTQKRCNLIGLYKSFMKQYINEGSCMESASKYISALEAQYLLRLE